MTLYEWAIKHQVGMDALVELRAVWGDVDTYASPESAKGGEALVQSRVVLEGSLKGVRLFRNNNGALNDKTGRPVRFGLANDSKARNQIIKSGDLIGIDSRPITLAEVGRPRGRFVSRECKPPGWTFGQDPEREGPQLAWAQLILSCGGDAAFCNAEGTL